MFGRIAPASLEHLDTCPLGPHLDMIDAPQPTPTGVKLYNTPIVYNQGSSPMCPGYSAAALMTATELPVWGAQMFDAPGIYSWANANDGLPQPHRGSTVHAAMQCLVDVGAALAQGWAPAPGEPGRVQNKNVLWANDIDTVCRYLFSQSGMVLGIDWYEGCMKVDAQGFIRPTGSVIGGHAIFCRGVNMTEKFLVLRQSWGPLWGCTVNNADGSTVMSPGADAKVHFEDFAALMGAQGEAAAIVPVIPSITAPASSTDPPKVTSA